MEVSIGSMFSGIGGLELGIERGLRRAGLSPSVRWQVEQDPYCRSVLRKHWPEATRYDDVTALPLESIGRVDLLCGGFPCQDLSIAGNGAGIEGARSGLWRSMYRAACALGPSIVIMENVPPILIRGIGVVFGQMASIGYDLWWDCIPAEAIGAPHQRGRWFCIAWRREAVGNSSEKRREKLIPPALYDGLGLPPGRPQEIGRKAASQSLMGRVSDGISRGMDGHRFPAGRGVTPHSWEPPRTRPKQPNDKARLRSLGNAVVPQVAEVIGAVAGEILRRGPPR